MFLPRSESLETCLARRRSGCGGHPHVASGARRCEARGLPWSRRSCNHGLSLRA
jgi:hypothetical protein